MPIRGKSNVIIHQPSMLFPVIHGKAHPNLNVSTSSANSGSPKISFSFSACSATAFRVSQRDDPFCGCETLKAVAEQALKEKLILGQPTSLSEAFTMARLLLTL